MATTETIKKVEVEYDFYLVSHNDYDRGVFRPHFEHPNGVFLVNARLHSDGSLAILVKRLQGEFEHHKLAADVVNDVARRLYEEHRQLPIYRIDFDLINGRS